MENKSISLVRFSRIETGIVVTSYHVELSKVESRNTPVFSSNLARLITLRGNVVVTSNHVKKITITLNLTRCLAFLVSTLLFLIRVQVQIICVHIAIYSSTISFRDPIRDRYRRNTLSKYNIRRFLNSIEKGYVYLVQSLYF